MKRTSRDKIAIELLRLARELSAKTLTLWHISNQRFRKFDPRMGAQGIMWFSRDRDDLVKNLHGASIRSSVPIWLYEVRVRVQNPAGWKEYERYMLDQLESMGYDAIDLGEDFVVFDAKNVQIVNVEQVNPKV